MASTTVFIHPRIRTLHSIDPIDGAIVAIDGKIAFIGALDAAREFAGEGAKELSLDGDALLPAFHDAHIHSGSVAAVRFGPQLSGAESYADVLARLRNFAAEHPGHDWVQGGQWDANKWEEGVQPHRSDLDEIFGERPVLLSTIDGHADWANTEALRRAGVEATTPDPDGGRIVRDGAGEATGVLLESAAGIAAEVADRESDTSAEALLLEAQDHLLSLGLAHITDIDGEDVLDGYLALRDKGELRIRVHKMNRAGDLPKAVAEGRKHGQGDEWVTTGPVKIFSDGALGPHTAHFHEDFHGEPGNHGIAVTSAADIERIMRECVDAGLGIAVHAIGDLANTIALDAFAKIADPARANNLPMRIEHAQHIRPADLDRFAQLGVTASMQPTHCVSDYPLSVDLLGERDTAHYPWRTLLDSGAALAFGSDAPVEPANPWLGIHAAVTRERMDGEPEGGREPHEKVTLTEALSAYTLAPAVAAGLGDRTGALEVGMFADFITVDRDPYDVPESDLWKLRTVATVVGGTVAFQA